MIKPSQLGQGADDRLISYMDGSKLYIDEASNLTPEQIEYLRTKMQPTTKPVDTRSYRQLLLDIDRKLDALCAQREVQDLEDQMYMADLTNRKRRGIFSRTSA